MEIAAAGDTNTRNQMKTLFTLIAVSACGFCQVAFPQEAITSYANGVFQFPQQTSGAGFAFSPLEPIIVTALGVSPNQAANLVGQVSLWDAAGNLIAFGPVGTGSPQFNQTVYNGTGSVILDAGATYYLQCVGFNQNWIGLDVFQGTYGGSFSVNPDISYLGGLYNYAPGSQPQLTPGEYFAGVNLEFKVASPEPSVTCLMLAASLGWMLGNHTKLRKQNSGS